MGKSSGQPVRVAVVGLGHFAQAAVLPAFEQLEGVELTALVSGSDQKRRELSKRYDVPRAVTYDEYDALLESGAVEAVYIALPNHLHAEYTIRAAKKGIHVLCEKAMAPTRRECEAMIEACETNGVRLMIGYRLHFEAGNLSAIESISSGEIGVPRLFNSTFSMQVREGNVRIRDVPGRGPLYDIGTYCINAARYLFRDDPIEVSAMFARRADDPRFASSEEAVAATLRFPGERLSTFVVSFGASDRSRYEVIGTTGLVELDPAYEYANDIKLTLRREGRERTRVFKKRDQVGAEIAYFADCIKRNIEPEPSGWEGLADVIVIEAIQQAGESGQRTRVPLLTRKKRPGPEQEVHVRAHDVPKLIDVESGSR